MTEVFPELRKERLVKLLISKKHNRNQFYVLFSLCVFLLFINYTLLISIPSIVFVAILVFAAFIGDLDELISICICCISWSEAIKWHYVLILCAVIFVIKYGKKVQLSAGIIPMILIVIWEYLHCFFGEVNLKSMISYAFLYVFFIIFFFIRDFQRIDYSFIVRNFAIAVIGVCCILVMRLLILNNFRFDTVFLDMRRLGNTDEAIGGLIINPNSLGVMCVMAIGGLMQIHSAGRKKAFHVLLIILLMAFGALTCSRTYLACLLILGAFLLMVSDRDVRQRVKFMLGSISVLAISVLLLYLLFPGMLDRFIYRLNDVDILSGRDTLFIAYNDYLFSSTEALFWGLGSLNLSEKVKQLSISFSVPHNGIQEILVAWGIIGLFLFAAMIYVLIRRSKQENAHQSLTNYALLVVLLAKIMVGQVITSSYTMLSFALIYLSLCHDCTSREPNRKVYK